MKRYFSKIIVTILIFGVFALANSFCFQGLFDFLSSVKAVPAMADNDNTAAQTDVCSDQSVAVPSDTPAMSVPTAGHSNSLLPCCLNGGHPSVIVSLQSMEMGKIIPAVSFSNEQVLKIVSRSTGYNAPIISPPKLLAVSTTILRL